MKLILNLLIPILDNSIPSNKYSKTYLNLNNVFEIEKDNKHRFSKEIKTKFEEITNQYQEFINKIPLIIIEKIYNSNKEYLKKMIFFDYKDNILEDVKVIELYFELENFFSHCFSFGKPH